MFIKFWHSTGVHVWFQIFAFMDVVNLVLIANITMDIYNSFLCSLIKWNLQWVKITIPLSSLNTPSPPLLQHERTYQCVHLKLLKLFYNNLQQHYKINVLLFNFWHSTRVIVRLSFFLIIVRISPPSDVNSYLLLCLCVIILIFSSQQFLTFVEIRRCSKIFEWTSMCLSCC